MIRKIALSLMMTAFIGTMIGCGESITEDQIKAWSGESAEFAEDFTTASTELANFKAMQTAVPVGEMDAEAKAKYDEAAAKLAEYETQLNDIGTKWAETMKAIGDGKDAAAWTKGVEAARAFIKENKEKMDNIKEAIEDMKDQAENAVASPNVEGDSVNVPATGTPAADQEKADSTK